MNKSGDYGVSGSAHPACNTRPVHTDGRVEDGRGSLALPSPIMGLPRLPASPFRRAVPTTPADQDGCACRLLPRSRGLPRYVGGSASMSLLSRPAQASLTLRPVELLSHPRRPSSRGSGPAGYLARPLVTYQSYRQLSGWILPPLVKRTLGAHCENQELRDTNDIMLSTAG